MPGKKIEKNRKIGPGNPKRTKYSFERVIEEPDKKLVTEESLKPWSPFKKKTLKKSVDSLIEKIEKSESEFVPQKTKQELREEAIAEKKKAIDAVQKGISILQNAIQKSVQVSPNDKVSPETKFVTDAGGQSECKQPTDAQAASLQPSKTEKDMGK